MDENPKDDTAEAEEIQSPAEEAPVTEDAAEVSDEAVDEETVDEPGEVLEAVEPAQGPVDEESGEQSLNAPLADVSPAEEGATVPDEPELPVPAEEIETSYQGVAKDSPEPKVEEATELHIPGTDAERGFVRPFRSKIKHSSGEVITLGDTVAENLARDPSSVETIFLPSYGAEVPVEEFTFVADGTTVGS